MFGISSALTNIYSTLEQYAKNLQHEELKSFNDEYDTDDEFSDDYSSVNSDPRDDESEDEDGNENEEAEHTIHDFDLVQELGEGQYGTVYLAGFSKNCERSITKSVAIKCMNKREVLKDIDQLYFEKRCLEMDSPQLLSSVCSFHDLNRVYFALEYCAGGDLFDLISNHDNNFTLAECKSVTYETALGIKYLHERAFVHRDIKPENLLLTVDGHIKIGDFGMAKELNAEREFRTKTHCGSPYATAPEVLDRKHYSFEVDVWSFGILLYEIVERGMPFPNTGHEYEDVMHNEYDPMKTESDECATVVARCLARDAAQRPGISDVVNSSFYQDLELYDLESGVGENVGFQRLISARMPDMSKRLATGLQDASDRFEKAWCEDLFLGTFNYTNDRLIKDYK
jgi:serine/threonine protein kinase